MVCREMGSGEKDLGHEAQQESTQTRCLVVRSLPGNMDYGKEALPVLGCKNDEMKIVNGPLLYL